LTNFIRAFFYGNIYLGFCAVALCIETNLLNQISLNLFPFYLLIFLCTIIYYSMIYVRSVGTRNYNERTIWYRKHLSSIRSALKITISLTVVFFLFLVIRNLPTLLLLSPAQFLLITAFPLVAAWYTFTPSVFRMRKIRQIGAVKPFVVGLTWAGWVTIYPILIWHVQKMQPFRSPVLPLILLLLQNFLFFSINAIIFDIKDYRTDSEHGLRTYPVLFGVRNTIRFVIFPLIFLNLIIFFLFQSQQNFSLLQTIIQIVPYLLLIGILLHYRQGRKVLYYLVAVDGLVFLKAFCGITSILLIKK
jgi:4-hydroxybenzoate polyprenyltransferase